MQAGWTDSFWWLERVLPYGLEIFVVVSGFAIFCFKVWQRKPGADWPTVEGRVQSARVLTGEGADRAKSAVITYSYFIKEYESGEYICSFLREDSARELADSLRDQKVTVHYNPRDPSISNLKKEELEKLMPVRNDNRMAS